MTLHDLIERGWHEAVGPQIAAVSRVKSFDADSGTLHVTAFTHDWFHCLHDNAKSIQLALPAEIDGVPVAGILWHLDVRMTA